MKILAEDTPVQNKHNYAFKYLFKFRLSNLLAVLITILYLNYNSLLLPYHEDYKNGATRTTGSQGPAPTRVRSSVPQPQPSNMVYGNGNMNSSQMLRPPAGLPSHLQRRPSATPSSSSYRSYQPPMNNKSPR